MRNVTTTLSKERLERPSGTRHTNTLGFDLTPKSVAFGNVWLSKLVLFLSYAVSKLVWVICYCSESRRHDDTKEESKRESKTIAKAAQQIKRPIKGSIYLLLVL